VIVDGVEEVLTVGPDQIEDIPGADASLIECIAKVGDRLIVLLKSTAIFAGAEYAVA
jgi:chemotaxis signal transduction protein